MDIKKVLEQEADQITKVDDNIIIETVGVDQAVDEVRKSLLEIKACLASRDFEKACQLGYGSVSNAYVFLQRTLGGLHDAVMDKELLVSEIASKAKLSYEKTLPQVDALLESSRPLVTDESLLS